MKSSFVFFVMYLCVFLGYGAGAAPVSPADVAAKAAAHNAAQRQSRPQPQAQPHNEAVTAAQAATHAPPRPPTPPVVAEARGNTRLSAHASPGAAELPMHLQTPNGPEDAKATDYPTYAQIIDPAPDDMNAEKLQDIAKAAHKFMASQPNTKKFEQSRMAAAFYEKTPENPQGAVAVAGIPHGAQLEFLKKHPDAEVAAANAKSARLPHAEANAIHVLKNHKLKKGQPPFKTVDGKQVAHDGAMMRVYGEYKSDHPKPQHPCSECRKMLNNLQINHSKSPMPNTAGPLPQSAAASGADSSTGAAQPEPHPPVTAEGAGAAGGAAKHSRESSDTSQGSKAQDADPKDKGKGPAKKPATDAAQQERQQEPSLQPERPVTPPNQGIQTTLPVSSHTKPKPKPPTKP